MRTDRRHRRLLQHDLAEPDAIGIRALAAPRPPRQVAAVPVIPVEQKLRQLAKLHRGFGTLRDCLASGTGHGSATRPSITLPAWWRGARGAAKMRRSLRRHQVSEERRGRLRAIAAEVPRIAGAVLGKRGFGEAQLVAQWPAIIGESLAVGVSPEKLSFPRGERKDGTLHLRVAPGLGLEVQHREPVLVERINAFFGYRAVARLALKQGPAPAAAPAPVRPRPLKAEERQLLDQRLAAIEDGELKAALQRLGAAVIGTAKPDR